MPNLTEGDQLLPLCYRCNHKVTSHAVDDEARAECMECSCPAWENSPDGRPIYPAPLDVIDAAAERYDPGHLFRVNADLRRQLQTERERSAKVTSALKLWTNKSDGHLPGVCFAQDHGGVCQCSDLRRALWAQVVEVLR